MDGSFRSRRDAVVHIDGPAWTRHAISPDLIIHADVVLYDRPTLSSLLDVDREQSDIDLLHHAWRRYGTGCAAHLNGDFAFVIEDRGSGRVYAARDPIGVRPLFYRFANGHLRFAGSVRELVDPEDPHSELDPAYIAQALSVGASFADERTYYRTIGRLMPGHWLTMDNGRVRTERYWHPERVQPLPRSDDQTYISRGRDLLFQAVNDRLDQQGKIGVHLTGGLDSSSIAVLAGQALRAKNLPQPVGFSWLETGPDLADTRAEDLLAIMRQALDMDVCIALQKRDHIDTLLRTDIARDFDAIDLMHELAVQESAAKRGVTTLLSGWGGDEFLSFHGRGLASEYFARGHWLALAQLAGKRSPKGFAIMAGRAVNERFALSGWQRRRRDPGFNMAHPDLRSAYPARRRNHVRLLSVRQTMLNTLAQNVHASRMENWAVSGMARGLRYRFPMLDKRIVEFVLSVPSHLFQRGQTRRWFFREITRDILPDAVRNNRSKNEQARVDALRRNTADAAKACLPELENGAAMHRRGLVDMDRLIGALRSPTLHETRNIGHVRRTLQFLDLP